jgi:hypothetical protein
MPFDSKRFLKSQFIPREDTVPVPDMQAFFPDGEDPVWTVRGLTGVEMAKANEAAERNRNISAILEGLVSRSKQEKIDSVRQLIGIDEKVPDDIAKRVELFILGSVEPKADTELALKVCTAFPIEFFEITNRITVLTGRGHVPGKPKPSGGTPKSR